MVYNYYIIIDLYCYIYKVVARALGSDYALASSSGFPLHVLNCCSGSFHGGASPRRPRGSYATVRWNINLRPCHGLKGGFYIGE